MLLTNDNKLCMLLAFRSIRKDPRRVTFKDHTEDMIPAEMEKIKPVRTHLSKE